VATQQNTSHTASYSNRRISGSKTIPFENVFIEKLYGEIVKIIADRKNIIDIGKRNKLWMEEFWNPETIVNEWERIYNKILGE